MEISLQYFYCKLFNGHNVRERYFKSNFQIPKWFLLNHSLPWRRKILLVSNGKLQRRIPLRWFYWLYEMHRWQINNFVCTVIINDYDASLVFRCSHPALHEPFYWHGGKSFGAEFSRISNFSKLKFASKVFNPSILEGEKFWSKTYIKIW